MKFGPDNYNHEERCSQGHSSASTIATIEAALSADPDIDSSAKGTATGIMALPMKISNALLS